MAESVTSLFLKFSGTKLFDEYWPRMRQSVESLTDEQVWWRPNDASNSIGNLLLHLDGNVTQWLVTSFDHRNDARNRPAEFAAREGVTRSELLERLERTMRQASDTLQRLTEADLLATYEIQGYTVTGLHAVYHAVEHFSGHYGQVLYVTKMLRGDDLGFYRELSATGRPRSSAKTAD